MARSLLVALTLCGVLTNGAVVGAEPAAGESGSDAAADAPAGGVSEAERPTFRQEMVVTAGRYEQDAFETPVPITVISREELEMRRPEKLVDLLKNLAGIEIFGEGPFRGLPVIRGLSSNRVLILVDGQRLNNARESTQFAGIQPSLVDLGQVERIEVLRGPASVLYGSDAMGGVINIITRPPPFGPERMRLTGSLGVEYGSAADSRRSRAEVSGAGPGTSFRLGVSEFSANSYRSPEGVVPNSGMRQRSADAGLRVLLGNSSLLRVSTEVVRTSDIGFPGYDPLTSGVDIAFPRFDRDKLAVTYEAGGVAGLSSLTLTAYVQQVVKESRRNIRMGPRFFLNTTTRSDIDSIGFNTQSRTVLGRHQLTFGVDARQDAVQDATVSESPFGRNTDVQVPRADQREFGVYLQDELSLGGRLHLVAGVRGDRAVFRSREDPDYQGEPFHVTDSAVSGNLGVRYRLTDHVQLTAVLGRAFRSPNLQERSYFGLVSTGDAYVVQNPSLKSETALNVDLGFKVRHSGFSAGFNVFRNAVNDLIGLAFLGTDPNSGLLLARFDNTDKAVLSGVEFELESAVTNAWTVFTAASYTRGTDDATGEPLPFIPPFKIAAGVRYAAERWWGELAGRWVGRQDRLPSDTEGDIYEPTPSFSVVEVRAGVELLRGVQLQAAVENVLDRAYHEPFNRRLEPGRNYRLSLTYRF